MNGAQAVAVTGATSFGVAQVSDILQWALNGFPHPAPLSVTMALAAVLLPIFHIVYLALSRRVQPEVKP